MKLIASIGASLSEPHIYAKYVNSIRLSVHTFITRQFTNVVLIYGVPSTVDCSFEDDIFKPGARRPQAPGFLKLILCGLYVCVRVCVHARGY